MLFAASCVQVARIGEHAVPDEGRRSEQDGFEAGQPRGRDHPRQIEEPLGLVHPGWHRMVVQPRDMLDDGCQKRVPTPLPCQLRPLQQGRRLLVVGERVKFPGELVDEGAVAL